ncbi:siderophore-interacting protein (plasmid) [Coraliomargarita sp. W4R53]
MALASRTSPRAPRPSIELEVVKTEQLSPYLVRITLGGDAFAQFHDRRDTDKYLKLKFTTPEPEAHQVTRTYTVRRVNAESLEVDFVVHGGEGLAGPWAAAAEVGAKVSFIGPGGGYLPNPSADWYLFTGDLSAMPAIAAALESLPADAVGDVILEVDAEDGILVDLSMPAGFTVRWIANPNHDVSCLADAVRALAWRDGIVDVFAHGERESIKALRPALFEERELPRGQVSLSGYWARGRTEDRFQAEKREPIGQIL